MYITKMYKIKVDNYIKVTSILPENITPIETLNILNAEENCHLIRKHDKKDVGLSIWLKECDNKENYTEVQTLMEINYGK